MILTITLNPSVDMNYKLDAFNIDDTNRIESVSKTAGGKGLNVARVVRQLGEDVGASGFLGGRLGDFIREEISEQNIQDKFIDIAGQTRHCIAILHEGKQTEILEKGPEIEEDEKKEFLRTLSDLMQNLDILTVSGSLPKDLDSDFYSQIIEIANRADVKVILDTNGELLKTTLENRNFPFMIKPNEKEFAELIGVDTSDEAQIIDALKLKEFKKIPLVVITAGKDGAFIKYEETVLKAKIPNINAVNPVGSGDAVVAGFAAGLDKQMTGQKLIKYGLTMGVVNAMEAETGSIDTGHIDWSMEQIELYNL